MSLEERYGTRGRAFSMWTRTVLDPLTGRPDRALDWIDLDCVPFCHHCRAVKALFELARDVGQDNKATTVLRGLARAAGVRGFLIYYTPTEDDTSITRVRIRQVEPWRHDVHIVAAEQFADWWRRLPCLNADCVSYQGLEKAA